MALSNLTVRTLFSLIMGPSFLLLAWMGGYAREFLLLWVVTTASWEYFRLIEGGIPDTRLPKFLFPACVLLLGLLASPHRPEIWREWIPLAFVVSVVAVLLVGFRKVRLENLAPWIALQAGGIGFFGIWGASLLALAQGPRGFAPLAPLGFALCASWSSDTGAYFTGRAFGRHKLSPSLSPSKTIEGAIGGLVAGALFGAVWNPWAMGRSVAEGVLIGLALAFVSMLGDLLESSIKRWAGRKDSSRIFPGHGGVFDRFDSVFLSAPLLLAYLRVFP